MKKKKKTKKSKMNKFTRIAIYLVFLLIVFKLAPNYEKNDVYVEDTINLIIDNNNVTKNLKYNLFINENNVIYMSIEDVRKYFDEEIKYDKERNEIVTVYGEKEAKLPLNENIIKINTWEIDVLSGAIQKDDMFYIPITAMGNIYELEIDYINKEKILLLDSLTKKLVKADVSKKCDVKYKPTGFSKTVAKLQKADKVICIEKLGNNWTKIRTKNGIIGYVKTKILQNEIYIRDDLWF